MLSREDQKRLQEIQAIPFEDNMFQKTAQSQKRPVEDLLCDIEDLRNKKLLRRWGAIIDARKLGYYSSLIALEVTEGKMDLLSQVISEMPGITHCYEREFSNNDGQISGGFAKFNIWLTLTSRSNQKFQEEVSYLRKSLSLERNQLLLLPSQHKYKVAVKLEF
ncbi:MAG: hypothetical protein ACE5OZ_16425 [Candidatus Heimdallarchaeota archaeon]